MNNAEQASMGGLKAEVVQMLEQWAGVPITNAADGTKLLVCFMEHFEDKPLPRELAELALGKARVRQLEDTAEALLRPVPKWDGVSIAWQGRKEPVRSQYNSVMVHILDIFEGAGWPETITVPESIDGDVKQAAYGFNQRRVVRLSVNGRNVSWS